LYVNGIYETVGCGTIVPWLNIESSKDFGIVMVKQEDILVMLPAGNMGFVTLPWVIACSALADKKL
jgi:hypothetical protein